jgi:GNAT superfamily N-acetyltransferase
MTTIGDSLAPVASAYAEKFAGLAVALDGTTRRGPHGTVLAVTGIPASTMNIVTSTRLDPDAKEIAHLGAAEELREVPWTIAIRGLPGPQVNEVAVRLGLAESDRAPLMVWEPSQGRPAPQAAGALRVRPVTGGDLGPYGRALAEGYEAPYEVMRNFENPAVWRKTGFTPYLAELDGVPVATGMTAVSGGLALIFNVATLPRYRRRGYARAMVLELVRAGFDAGAPTVHLYPSKMGQSMYEAAGFRYTGEVRTLFTRAAD